VAAWNSVMASIGSAKAIERFAHEHVGGGGIRFISLNPSGIAPERSHISWPTDSSAPKDVVYTDCLSLFHAIKSLFLLFHSRSIQTCFQKHARSPILSRSLCFPVS